MRQNEVSRGSGDLVACCAQAHLQQCPIEANCVHARERTEVGVQEGPVVEPRGGMPAGEHALRHGVERGVGEGADRAGGLGLFRAAGGGGRQGHGDHLTRLALRSKVTDAAFA